MSESLVIQTAFIGDAVLTTPLVAELAARGPVDVVTTPAGASLLANNPTVRRTIAWDKHRDGSIAGMLRLVASIRADSPEAAAYCAQGSLRTALLARLAGYRKRVGFDTSAGRRFYTHRVRHVAGQHHAERLLRLAVGDETPVNAGAVRPRLYPGHAERAAVDALLAEAAGEPLVVLAPGSIWGTKRWPGYPELARDLAGAARLAVVGADDDRLLAAAIVEAAGEGVIDATGRLSLLASAELIGRASLLVTNDSAPQHLASAMGTPTLTIFGPTVPAFGFGPLAPGSDHLGVDHLPCRPCDHHGPATCPLAHHRCMRDLDVPRVLSAARLLLRTAHA